jgi:outer membrane protein assembly factor BamE (lipoprotein component of BamABCDE complex)
MVAGKKILILSFLLVGTSFIKGCMVIPTVPHDIGVVPDKEAIKIMVPGETTRADVLHLLGEPMATLNDDQFFMYKWEKAYAYFFIYFQGGVGGPITESQYLCIEFGADSLLVRLKYLSGGRGAIKRCMGVSDEQNNANPE